MPLVARDTTYPLTPVLGNGTGAPVDIGPAPELPASTATVNINEDGSVSLGSLVPTARRAKGDNFDENLAEDLDDNALAMIAEDILQGIDSDILSRTEFIGNYEKGISLLGLKIEDGSNTKGQKRNVSRVNHPALLESCVRGQAQARGELLPAAGPVKVLTYGGSDASKDQMAQAFENDMNHFLTVVANEYYPDFDRGLFSCFYGGNLFKKVYNHPIKRRPAADCINVQDLIVSEDATDLETALRVTHRTFLSPAITRRMQLNGTWRDTMLGQAMPVLDPLARREKQVMGINPMAGRPQDQERCVYETYTDIDLSPYGFGEKGQPDGLPLPYVVTIDKDSRQVLALRRGWRKGDKLFVKRQRFVHYGLVPGFGFLCMGYLHLLGNQTRALTAIWRILCDAGMFANFPGGVKAKGVRMSTNEIQPGPGEWPDVDIGPFDDIHSAMMPMPYKDPSMVFIQLAEIIGADAQRMAGAVEMDSGDGRTNIPVGTILSMIEQQTQVMSAVHKRLHTAQARELQLLKECFAEDPTALSRFSRNPAKQWETAEEFADMDLVPASDPNVPAQTHRVMQAQALVMLASTNPDIYDKVAVHKRALRAMGINDGDSFLHEPPPPPPGPPGEQPDPTGPAKIALEQQEQQRKAASEAVQAQQRQQQMAVRAETEEKANATRERIAEMSEETERMRLAAEMHRTGRQENREDDRLEHEKEQAALGPMEPKIVPGTRRSRATRGKPTKGAPKK